MNDKVILLNSNEVVDVSPKLLNPDNVQYGELGVNYHKGTETISTRNDENDIAEFVPYSIYDEIVDGIQNEVFYETDEPIGKTGDIWIYKIPPIPFTLEFNVSADDLSVQFPISGNVNCEVDWGDGRGKETITTDRPSHNYSSPGTYTVKVYGDFERMYKCSNNVTKVVSWGNSNTSLNSMYEAFLNCVNLTSIPNDEYGIFSNVTDFNFTFNSCTSLVTIPENLFTNCSNVTHFNGTFSYCSGLTGSIPEGLFSNCTNVTTFNNTFGNCSGLTGSIPENLFATFSKVTTFSNTFYGCSSLISIPEGLFSNCSNVASFDSTFSYCKNLTGNTPTGTDGLELWERAGQHGYPSSISGKQCFKYCSKLSNYSSIPTEWK